MFVRGNKAGPLSAQRIPLENASRRAPVRCSAAAVLPRLRHRKAWKKRQREHEEKRKDGERTNGGERDRERREDRSDEVAVSGRRRRRRRKRKRSKRTDDPCRGKGEESRVEERKREREGWRG